MNRINPRAAGSFCILFLFQLVVLTLTLSAQSSDQTKLDKLMDDYFEEYLKNNPLAATSIGDYRYNDKLEINIGKEYRAKSRLLDQSFLNKLENISESDLDENGKENYRIFKESLTTNIEQLSFPSHLMPINPFSSFVVNFVQLGSGDGAHPFKTVKDYKDFLSRMNYVSMWIDTAIMNMNRGIEKGFLQPKTVIESTLPTIESQVVENIEESTFYKPIQNFPEEFNQTDKKSLIAEYKSAIKNKIIPAYKKLADYLKETYLPKARTTISLSEIPNGEEWYRSLINYYTTTDMAPEEIFELGVSEINRIQGRADEIFASFGLEGNLTGTLSKVFQKRNLITTNKEEVFTEYDKIYEKIKENISKLFNVVPKAPFEIREVEPYRSASSPPAFYNRPTEDGERPGIFYINFINGRYNKLTMEALFLHEAWPGHHYQIAIAQELENIPRFRKFGYYGAYIEGWGLYTEKLGYDLGLYKDEIQELGMLVLDWLRASRLVGDVGIHYKGWTKEEAQQKLAEYNAGSAISEINRYSYIPAQALSYKIGEQKILNLRKKAKEEMGEDFDIKHFHDVVLGSGSLPLNILEEKIDQLIMSK